ncbi:MAG: leukocyte elastase inhibitor-like, partial [Pedosphaera sp.]|nr:leukocyte elastase inhibitor-like [Pedosphaera sp.]
PFVPAFLHNATNYEASLNQVDFTTATEPVRQQINGWVAQHTKGTIKDVLPPGMLTRQTSFVLVNAVYFKSHWYERTVPQYQYSNRAIPFTGWTEKGRADDASIHISAFI